MDSVRIDKWLWAARLFKHRSAATQACIAGHVKIDGGAVKASKLIGPDLMIHAVTPGGYRIVEVIALADKRGNAKTAEALYVDHSPPPPKLEPWEIVERRAGRPTKRSRQELKRLKGRDW